jgi:hypothetical protein
MEEGSNNSFLGIGAMKWSLLTRVVVNISTSVQFPTIAK